MLTNEERSSLERIIEDGHGGCDNNTCDIDAARRAGFIEVAAHNLHGATEVDELDDFMKDHSIFDDDAGTMPHRWTEWHEWFTENTVQCQHCEAFVFTDENEGDSVVTCGNCLADVHLEGDPLKKEGE